MVRSSSAPPCAPRKKQPWINRIPAKAHLNNARILNNRLQKVINRQNEKLKELERDKEFLTNVVQNVQSKLKAAGNYGNTKI